ncbi:hypothetical protein DFQ26_002682 [Actinomortierella ambigua]|nr:hypothetical protein DFQ26_002682 [Actinomortierella ambigua]
MTFQYIERLQTDFGCLINNQSGHDVKFLVGQSRIIRFGHSQILAARCPYFNAALNPRWRASSNGTFLKPDIEPRVFDLILEYLYIGQIEVTMDIISPLVDAAIDLGLSQLVSECEIYARQQVTSDTVFDLMSLANRHGLERLWVTTTNYFDTYAERLLNTDNWYGTEEDLLIKILSRESIGASELSVWKAIVRFAYFANGYDVTCCPLVRHSNLQGRLVVNIVAEDDSLAASLQNTVVNIPRQEFEKLSATIIPLLRAVRFTSLTVGDFDRFIQGTQLVPPELCLRVYRHFQMPLVFPNDPDSPRGTMLLPRDQWPKLISWVKDAMGGTSAFSVSKRRPTVKLLYMASKYGFKSGTFHQYCDEKGPTLTVARTSTSVVGGFNAVSWKANDSWSSAAKNFLFEYSTQTGQMLRVGLMESQKACAAYNSSAHGPVFGYGYDLKITSDGQNSNLSNLVNNEDRHDVKFLVGAEEAVRYGHSQILAARCPYFAMALKPCWSESTEGIFCKPNIEPRVFDIILRYLYTGQVTLTADIIPSFVEAAVELLLDQLVVGCEDYACENVDMNTVCDLLALASRHNMEKLLNTASDFFDVHAEELLDGDDWLSLDTTILADLFSRDSLIAKELTVWKAAVRYAYHREKFDVNNRPLLQFPEWPSRLVEVWTSAAFTSP